MAEVNQDWRKTPERGFFLAQNDGAPILILAFDIVLSESHASELSVTDNPVETGVVVSDHAFMLPKTLDLEIGISDVSLAPGGVFPEDDPFTSIASRSSAALEILENLQASAEPFDVQTGLALRKNMVITRIEAQTDKDSAGVLLARLSLREVLIVSTETVTYPPRKDKKTSNQASKKVSGGEKTAEAETDQTKTTSALGSLFGVDTPQGQAIGNANPDIEPALKKFYGPGSGLPN